MAQQNGMPQSSGSPFIGYIVGGSLKSNLKVRLTVSPDQVQEGAFIVIEDNSGWLFYGLVTDIQLGATDSMFAEEHSSERLPTALARLLHGQTLYTNLEILPALMLESVPGDQLSDEDHWPVPVKSVPAHHSLVRLAHAGDIAQIFGKEGKEENFVIGHTREQGHPVCINLDKFVQRSSGIFGATGTGKSFLTRVILAGLIHYNRSSLLVFDMHNEYGFDDRASDTKERVIGLRTKFPAKVRVVGLGRGTTIRGNTPDFHLELAEADIQPEDIELLMRELNLKETTPTTLDALIHTFGRNNWYHEFKTMEVGSTIENEEGKRVPAPGSVAYWANESGVNVVAAEALHSKLSRVFKKTYIVEKPVSNGLGEIIKGLENGQHIILSFGRFDSDLDYLLVSNLLTRRIRDKWEEQTNLARSQDQGEPRPLVIVVEEAHKLLNREMASQTTFSTIARELRKYYVTLLIIDQRPSQIYDEVLSQLGTRISGWLGDEADIHAVLSGLAGRDALRGMLARLQPKEEVLLLGWGVSMPIPVRSRRYNLDFWDELQGKKKKMTNEDRKKLLY
jgi:DNA helicase HerA-like ATPase